MNLLNGNQQNSLQSITRRYAKAKEDDGDDEDSKTTETTQ